ncbi:hypothetical protein ACFYO2_45220 [Streptomyces sp. NPDC006602]|uniref:hypothetical protein n=1 Tax=Streptomyces sp. NPDC006602 TaxID=3364751 RepID=UPI0036BDD418
MTYFVSADVRAYYVCSGAGTNFASADVRTHFASSGVRTCFVSSGVPIGPAKKRRGAPLPVAADGRQGHLSRPAARRGRGFPGPASSTTPTNPHCTPVPAPAHHTPRAIRVRRSPR